MPRDSHSAEPAPCENFKTEAGIQVVSRLEEEYEGTKFYKKKVQDRIHKLDKLSISCFNRCHEEARKALEASIKQRFAQNALKTSITFAAISAMEHLESVIPKSVFKLFLGIVLGGSAYSIYLIVIDLIDIVKFKSEVILPDWLLIYMKKRAELTRSRSEGYLYKAIDGDIIDIDSTGRRWSSGQAPSLKY